MPNKFELGKNKVKAENPATPEAGESGKLSDEELRNVIGGVPEGANDKLSQEELREIIARGDSEHCLVCGGAWHEASDSCPHPRSSFVFKH